MSDGAAQVRADAPVSAPRRTHRIPPEGRDPVTGRVVPRPSPVTADVQEVICTRIAAGESLRRICEDPDLPGLTTVKRALRQDPAFREVYRQAREDQADTLVDQMLELAAAEPARLPTGGYDSAHVNHVRNRIGTLQWIAAKLRPKRYGDKLDVQHGGDLQLAVVTGVPRVQREVRDVKPLRITEADAGEGEGE